MRYFFPGKWQNAIKTLFAVGISFVLAAAASGAQQQQQESNAQGAKAQEGKAAPQSTTQTKAKPQPTPDPEAQKRAAEQLKKSILRPASADEIVAGGTVIKPSDAKPSTSKALKVKVTRGEGAPPLITLEANDVPFTEVAMEIGRQLKIPVVVSRVMGMQRLSLAFENLPLEDALRQMTPQAYVDYLLDEDFLQRKPVAVYLQSVNERRPQNNNEANAASDSTASFPLMVVSGDTEDSTVNPFYKKPDEEQPLRVTYNDGKVSVRARQFPLGAILYAIADKADISAELGYDPTQKEASELGEKLNALVDANFSDYTIEDAVRTLTRDVRLYVRTDIQTSETKPIRIVLAVPAKKVKDTKGAINKSAN